MEFKFSTDQMANKLAEIRATDEKVREILQTRTNGLAMYERLSEKRIEEFKRDLKNYVVKYDKEQNPDDFPKEYKPKNLDSDILKNGFRIDLTAQRAKADRLKKAMEILKAMKEE